jgi:Ser/Thr protein kinase RdoA (MazF antagonist)
MILPGRDAEAARQRRLLIEAYRQFRDFDERWLRLVEPLRAFRFVFYAAWIARRWRDPAFPSAFPHFGSADYWERETRDLEEHVEGMVWDEEAPDALRGAAGEPEPVLSNEEIFWDL